MFVAALAASTVAFGACDKPDGPTPKNCSEVYDVAFTLKTTTCKCKTIKTTEIVGNECGKDKVVTTDCVAWREVVTKKVAGNIWSCSCSCSEDLDVDSTLEVTPAWWDLNPVAADAQGNQYFWFSKEKKALTETLMTFKHLARIGKAKTTVEAAGTFGDGINFAGFGTYDAKNMRVKSITGHAAGVWGAPYDCTSDDYTQPDDCPAYQLCDATTALDDYAWTAAAGTFTVKYNASKSAKLAKGVLPVKEMAVVFPSYESLAM